MKKFISISAVLGFTPLVSLAASEASAWTILSDIGNLLGKAIPVLITLAVVFFIWGVIQYTLSTDEEAKKKAKDNIIKGLIGLFVIVAFWGIVSLVTSTFGVGPGVTPVLPCIDNPGAGIYCD